MRCTDANHLMTLNNICATLNDPFILLKYYCIVCTWQKGYNNAKPVEKQHEHVVCWSSIKSSCERENRWWLVWNVNSHFIKAVVTPFSSFTQNVNQNW